MVAGQRRQDSSPRKRRCGGYGSRNQYGGRYPVTLGGGKIDDVMKEKMENDAAALMRSVVSKRGRNVEIAESTVRQSKSFTEQEALSQKLIDYVAKE